MAEFVETRRGGKALHYEGYIYTKIREGKEGNTLILLFYFRLILMIVDQVVS